MIEKALIEGLADQDYCIRMRTIYKLVDQRQAEAIPLILPLLKDREMPVRCAAIAALGKFGDPQAFEPLVACLNARTSLERQNAVEALVVLGDPRRRDPFLEALRTAGNPPVRLIKALSVFPDEEVLEALIQRLNARDDHVRATVAVALGKMGQPRAIPALQQMALTDTNQETTIHGLYTLNSTVAERAIQMILHPEQEHDLDWPG